VFKVECCIDFSDQIGGYAVLVATASGSVRQTIHHHVLLEESL
jgi:hypothetical protein